MERIGFGRAYCFAIAHAIERDGPIAQFHEVRDLVAPAERRVREAMDQDDRAFGLSFWQSFEVIFVDVNVSVNYHVVKGDWLPKVGCIESPSTKQVGVHIRH